jgi:hypothetical protein
MRSCLSLKKSFSNSQSGFSSDRSRSDRRQIPARRVGGFRRFLEVPRRRGRQEKVGQLGDTGRRRRRGSDW